MLDIHSTHRFVRTWLQENYAQASAVFLAGSTVYSEFTTESDIDLVLIDAGIEQPFHHVFVYEEHEMELFAMHEEHVPYFFEQAIRTAIPTLPHMMANGIILINERGLGEKLKALAIKLIHLGPGIWTLDEANRERYEITEYVKDLKGAVENSDSYYIVQVLMEKVPLFYMRTKGEWIGKGKWMRRMMEQANPELAARWIDALHQFFQHEDKAPILIMITEILEPYGGLWLDGFYEEAELP